MRFLISTFILLLLGLFSPLAIMSHNLDAPDMVQASIDGSFGYEWVFTAGPGSALIAGSGWDGLANVSGALHGDCFCVPEICMLEEGETTTFSVRGNLQDPNQPGSVMNWVALCDALDLNVPTVVLPFGTVPIEAKTWSQIKALYR
jgi:hypothetical protein